GEEGVGGIDDLVDRGVAGERGVGVDLAASRRQGTQLVEQIGPGSAPRNHEVAGPPFTRPFWWINVPATYRSRSSARRSFPLVVRAIVPFGASTISSTARPVAWSTRRRTSASRPSSETSPCASTRATAGWGYPGGVAANAAPPRGRTPGAPSTADSRSWGK